MAQRMALYMQDKHPIRYEIEMVKYAEERGFSEIWQADTRLARDCVVLMSAFLAETKRMRIGSGVLPIWTRNPAVIAATWSTMWELAGKADGRGRLWGQYSRHVCSGIDVLSRRRRLEGRPGSSGGPFEVAGLPAPRHSAAHPARRSAWCNRDPPKGVHAPAC